MRRGEPALALNKIRWCRRYKGPTAFRLTRISRMMARAVTVAQRSVRRYRVFKKLTRSVFSCSVKSIEKRVL